MFDIRVEHAAASRMLDGISDRLERPSAALRVMGEELADYEADVFATANHGAWAPLNEATVRAKNSSRILVDSGDLMASLTGSRGIRTEGDSVRVESDVAYARFQGGRRDPTPEPSYADVRRMAGRFLDTIVPGR